jgi:hypothetical protein
MTKADQIRALAKEGLRNADIARRLEIRPQHVSTVLRRSSIDRPPSPARAAARPIEKPPLTTDILIEGGFERAAQWVVQEDELVLDGALPKLTGVYAMVQDGAALYVGVAANSLAHRFKFYVRPGVTQTTSIRVKAELRGQLDAGKVIEIFVVCPPTLQWNGLPVNGAAGLEVGLISTYSLPWNKRGA